MGIKGKTIMKIGAGLGSIIAAGAGLLLAKKSGELTSEDSKDMTKLSPLGEDEDDVIGDEIVVMEPEDTDEPEEDEDDE